MVPKMRKIGSSGEEKEKEEKEEEEEKGKEENGKRRTIGKYGRSKGGKESNESCGLHRLPGANSTFARLSFVAKEIHCMNTVKIFDKILPASVLYCFKYFMIHTVRSVQYAVGSIHCILYSLHSGACSVHCIVLSIQYEVYHVMCIV